MSLTGIINTHTMVATLFMRHGTDEQQPASAAVDGDGRAARRAVAVRARRRQRHPQHLVQGARATATSTSSTAPRPGSPTASGPRSSRWRPDRRRHLRRSSSRRSRVPAFEGISVCKHVGKLGYRGVETVEMSYVGTASPPPTSSAKPGAGFPRSWACLEVGRINIASRAVGVARAAFDAAPSYAQQRRDVRQAHRRAPGHPAQARRHGDPPRGGPAADRGTRPSARRRGCAATSRRAWPSSSPARRRSSSATEAMRIHGGVGYTTELPVERYYRDAPLMVDRRGHQRDPASGHRPRACCRAEPAVRLISRGRPRPRPAHRPRTPASVIMRSWPVSMSHNSALGAGRRSMSAGSGVGIVAVQMMWSPAWIAHSASSSPSSSVCFEASPRVAGQPCVHPGQVVAIGDPVERCGARRGIRTSSTPSTTVPSPRATR